MKNPILILSLVTILVASGLVNIGLLPLQQSFAYISPLRLEQLLHIANNNCEYNCDDGGGTGGGDNGGGGHDGGGTGGGDNGGGGSGGGGTGSGDNSGGGDVGGGTGEGGTGDSAN